MGRQRKDITLLAWSPADGTSLAENRVYRVRRLRGRWRFPEDVWSAGPGEIARGGLSLEAFVYEKLMWSGAGDACLLVPESLADRFLGLSDMVLLAFHRGMSPIRLGGGCAFEFAVNSSTAVAEFRSDGSAEAFALFGRNRAVGPSGVLVVNGNARFRRTGVAANVVDIAAARKMNWGRLYDLFWQEVNPRLPDRLVSRLAPVAKPVPSIPRGRLARLRRLIRLAVLVNGNPRWTLGTEYYVKLPGDRARLRKEAYRQLGVRCGALVAAILEPELPLGEALLPADNPTFMELSAYDALLSEYVPGPMPLVMSTKIEEASAHARLEAIDTLRRHLGRKGYSETTIDRLLAAD